MSSIRDLVTGSLRLIEEVGAGETCTAESATDGLTSLNAMIGSWSIQGDLIYTETTEAFSTTAGDPTKTIGPTGDWVTTRPLKLIRATVEYPQGLTYELEIFDAADYAGVTDKTFTGFPEVVYFDGNFPNSTLTFWPVPSQNFTVTLYSQKALSEYSSINDTLTVPPGYERAFRYNLACEIAPEYGKSASASVMRVAIESKNAVQGQNNLNDMDRMRVDPGLMISGNYNIYNGRY